MPPSAKKASEKPSDVVPNVAPSLASGINAVFAVILVPTTPVAVRVPVEALYDSPPSVFGAKLQ